MLCSTTLAALPQYTFTKCCSYVISCCNNQHEGETPQINFNIYCFFLYKILVISLYIKKILNHYYHKIHRVGNLLCKTLHNSQIRTYEVIKYHYLTVCTTFLINLKQNRPKSFHKLCYWHSLITV